MHMNNHIHEVSPSSLNFGDMHIKNIGKIQPHIEIKSLNEQIIRGKLYRDK